MLGLTHDKHANWHVQAAQRAKQAVRSRACNKLSPSRNLTSSAHLDAVVRLCPQPLRLVVARVEAAEHRHDLARRARPRGHVVRAPRRRRRQRRVRKHEHRACKVALRREVERVRGLVECERLAALQPHLQCAQSGWRWCNSGTDSRLSTEWRQGHGSASTNAKWLGETLMWRSTQAR
jgi:hypothetical protein